jgi:Protein of unknown function, DUF481
MLILSSATAWSQPKTDVVMLANGDRITGEVGSLDRGRLEFKTDDVGTIEIEWDNVAHLEATRQFEIALSDGRRFLGSLGPATARFVRIVTAAGDESIAMSEVTSIWPIGASFWAKLDGSVNAGFSYTRSSGIAQTTLNSDTAFRRPAFVARLTASATVTEQSGDTESDDRASVELSYLRYRGLRWFVGAAGLFEANESLGLELRSQVGVAVGQRLLNTNSSQLEIGGGVVVNEERGVDTAPTQNVEGLAIFRSSYFTYDGAKTGFDIRLQYYPSFSSWGRQRLQFDTSFSTEVWKDLHFAIDFYDTFDSEPPSADAERNDVGIVTSIGWKY